MNSPKYLKRFEVRNQLPNYVGCANYYSILNRSERNSFQYRLSSHTKFPACHYHLKSLLYKEKVGDNSTDKDQNEENLSLFQKLKLMYTRYWYVVIPVHGVTSIFWFGGFFFAAKSGVDITPILEKLNISMPYLLESDIGYYGIAYAMYKIASPARYTVTLGCTTFAINYLKNRGYIKPVPTKEELKVMYEDKREELKEKSEEIVEKYQEKKGEMKEMYHEKVVELREKYHDKADEMRGRYKERRRKLPTTIRFTQKKREWG
ncbi:C18orf19-like protein B [Armadillidium nasatum]|uniref:C18orf19-like protein B n=1 Tax=Armadillidium nasatum TaxID=96803 RepID=A0A5N5SKX8_9CRUS|nr:C18orf19-like protein B [Armadillidium nasatum]